MLEKNQVLLGSAVVVSLPVSLALRQSRISRTRECERKKERTGPFVKDVLWQVDVASCRTRASVVDPSSVWFRRHGRFCELSLLCTLSRSHVSSSVMQDVRMRSMLMLLVGPFPSLFCSLSAKRFLERAICCRLLGVRPCSQRLEQHKLWSAAKKCHCLLPCDSCNELHQKASTFETRAWFCAAGWFCRFVKEKKKKKNKRKQPFLKAESVLSAMDSRVGTRTIWKKFEGGKPNL